MRELLDFEQQLLHRRRLAKAARKAVFLRVGEL
jgi:hypothetical protein